MVQGTHVIATTRVRTGAALPSLAGTWAPMEAMPRHMVVLMWRVRTHPMGGKMRAEIRLRLNARAGRLSVAADMDTPTSTRLGFPSARWTNWAEELTDLVARGSKE